jgi:copper chaperone CopZ
MAATHPTTETVETVRWHLPNLIEQPVVGTSCCASTAEAIVAQELSMLRGIEDVAVDAAAGFVTVTFRPEIVSAAQVADALAEVGYPPALAQT